MTLGRRSRGRNIFSCIGRTVLSKSLQMTWRIFSKILAVEWIIFSSEFQAVILDKWWEILRVLRRLRFREENQKGESVGASFLAILMAGRECFQVPANYQGCQPASCSTRMHPHNEHW